MSIQLKEISAENQQKMSAAKKKPPTYEGEKIIS